MRATQINDALAAHFSRNHIWFAQVKDGPTFGRHGLQILDGVAVRKTWSPPEIVGVEIKVSRSDFLGDTKWPGYLDLCHRFYFACPRGMVKKEEVDLKAGLIEISPSGVARTTRKAPFRAVELDPTLLLYLVLWRSESTGKRSFVAAEMAEDKKVGQQYACYVSKKLNEANMAIRDMRFKLDLAEREAQEARDRKSAWARLLDTFQVEPRNLERMIEQLRSIPRLYRLRDDVAAAASQLTQLANALNENIQ